MFYFSSYVLFFAAIILLATNPLYAEDGKQAFIDNCAACHGENAHGIADQGASLVDSPFLNRRKPTEILDFLKTGRQPDSPDSKMKLLMPAFDYLTDGELNQIIAYVRKLK